MMKLRDILGVLRDSYCRTVGIEYMHIQDPEQRQWIQDHVEKPQARGRRTTSRCASCAGSTRPRRSRRSCRRSTSAEAVQPRGRRVPIAAARRGPDEAADADLDEAVIGMAHRGRLNVLTNIAGKTYGQIFREFEGNQDPRSVAGLRRRQVPPRHRGHVPRPDGEQIPVYLAANPIAPRGRRRGARGHRPGQAGRDRPGRARLHRAARAHPRRRRVRGPGRRRRDAATCRSCAPTAPAARSTSTSTTRSASPPAPSTRASACTPPMWPG